MLNLDLGHVHICHCLLVRCVSPIVGLVVSCQLYCWSRCVVSALLLVSLCRVSSIVGLVVSALLLVSLCQPYCWSRYVSPIVGLVVFVINMINIPGIDLYKHSLRPLSLSSNSMSTTTKYVCYFCCSVVVTSPLEGLRGIVFTRSVCLCVCVSGQYFGILFLGY